MKKALIVAVAFAALGLASCSTSQQARKPDSVAEWATKIRLEGNRLGQAHYKLGHSGPNTPAVRLYLHPLPDEPGSYTAVVHEYPQLLSIAPQYVAARKAEWINEYIGYLKHITAKMWIYKVVPTGDKGTYELQPLKVSSGRLEAFPQTSPRYLVLSAKSSTEDPLLEAKITSGGTKEAEVDFPGAWDGGVQYRLAKRVYQLAKLESTWRKSYLTGDYLAAYGKKKDVVLKLHSKGGADMATFVNNAAMFKVDMSNKKSVKAREKVFTHPQSAFLEGDYTVSEPLDGMFMFKPVQEGQKGSEYLVNRVALFVDVFDATKSLHQDVVELAVINPENPADFMMYYEHPDNGEGTGSRE